MAVGDELRQDLQADATNKALAIQTVQVSSNDARAGATWETEKKASRPAATRTNQSTADASGDVSANYSSAVTVGNSRYAAVYLNFDAASQSAAVCMALWDAGNNFLGLTEDYTFTASAGWTDGTNYAAPRYIFDISGAAKAYPLIKSISSGGEIHNIYVMPL